MLAGPHTFLEVGACRIGNCTEKMSIYLCAHVVKNIYPYQYFSLTNDGLILRISNLPASYELWLLIHKKGAVLCLFQKNIIAHFIAKQGKGTTSSDDFQEKVA